uniref:Uncharacterized protein n=1 Tax=Anguilla anguilla TaxID=7936 RepID=A0A0E9SYB3_ANGAN
MHYGFWKLLPQFVPNGQHTFWSFDIISVSFHVSGNEEGNKERSKGK